MNFYNNFKIKTLSKREKFLFLILFTLLFEIVLFKFVFARKASYIKLKEDENISTISEIKSSKKEINNINKVYENNTSLLKKSKPKIINTYKKEEFLDFTNKFPCISKTEDFETLEINIRSSDLSNLENISDYYIFKEFKISKINEEDFQGKINLFFENETNIINPVDEAKEVNNLNKYYFHKNNIKKDSLVKTEEVSNKKIKNNKSHELKNEPRSKVVEEKEIVKESKTFSQNNLKLDDMNLYMPISFRGGMSYIEDYDFYDFILENNSDDINISLLLFEDIEEIKSITFEIFLRDDLLSEIGGFGVSKYVYEDLLEKNKWNNIEIVVEDESFLEGLYFLVEKNCKCEFIIRNLKVE